jgi:hypothetical protein
VRDESFPFDGAQVMKTEADAIKRRDNDLMLHGRKS